MTDAAALMCAGEINKEEEGIKEALEAASARSVSGLRMTLIQRAVLIHCTPLCQ